MAKREKRTIVAGVTPEQFQDAMAAYALADASTEKLTAKMNLDITKIREKNEPELTTLAAEKEAKFEIIQSYCMDNKATLFVKQRHIETVHGNVGLRLGTPKLKTLPKFTWEKVLDKLGTILPDYVRVKKEVDKDRLLADRADATVATHLSAVGMYVDQDEAFYIELKKEEAAG